MSAFVDLMLLRFLDGPFVRDFIENQVGLGPLFTAAYTATDVDVRELALATVLRTEFAAPTIETIKSSGSRERTSPTPERIQVEGSLKRFGRLVWVDVFLDLLLAATVQDLRMPLDAVRTRDLLAEVGGAATLGELRTKLEALYPASVVDALFQTLRITTLAEFEERMNLFVQLAFKAPLPFDGDDPASTRSYPLNVCVKLQADLNVGEALQNAKLARSIMQREADFLPQVSGADVRHPFVFVTVFPDAAAVDGAIPGLTAAQIKTGIRGLFGSEGMVAHFLAA